jgi:hypothetical protein
VITVAMIEARRRELEARRDQALADLNALAGALQDCEYWLTQVAETGPPPPAAVPAEDEAGS